MAKLRLKHVNAFRNKQRKDIRPRYYFRRRGGKAIPLPGLPGSEEFMAAYAAALANSEHQELDIGASRTLPGTINALCVAYYTSDAWQTLAPDSKNTRRPIIERFRLQHGDKRVVTLERHNIERMLEAIAKPSAKVQWLKTIRGLLQAAVPLMRRDNPAAGIAHIKMPKTKGFHNWTDEEIAQYRAHWPLGTQQRLAMEFALETFSRRNEVVRLGPQHIKDGRIKIARSKGSLDVDILMSPELQAACAAMPKQHLTFLVTSRGKPRSKYGIGADFAAWVTAAGLPRHCRMHGLKKAGMRRLAEDGATTHELMGISGHKTLTMVQLYTEDVNRRLLADKGMAKKRARS
jgi:integrase